MKKTTLFLLLVLSFNQASADIASLYNQEETKYGQSATHLQELKKQLGDKLAQRHFVYVAGFFNEGLPFQFIKNEEALRELGAVAITKIYPSSRTSVSQFSDTLAQRLRDLYFRGNEKGEGRGLPIVLIGHSKGGVEVALTAIRNPILVATGILEKVVSVQAAFETPLGDLAGVGTQLCGSSYSPCHFINEFFSGGLDSLRASVSHQIFNDALTQLKNTGLESDVSQALFYVRGSQTLLGGMAPAIVGTHLYLNKFGPNDGLVTVDQQMLANMGTDLGIMDADHAELIIHKGPQVYGEIILNSTRAHRIKSFMRALIQSLYLNN